MVMMTTESTGFSFGRIQNLKSEALTVAARNLVGLLADGSAVQDA